MGAEYRPFPKETPTDATPLMSSVAVAVTSIVAGPFVTSTLVGERLTDVMVGTVVSTSALAGWSPKASMTPARRTIAPEILLASFLIETPYIEPSTMPARTEDGQSPCYFMMRGTETS
jgi:hypothetical protein